MTDFRADLGKVLEGQDGQQVVETIKGLVMADGHKVYHCHNCNAKNEIRVMDSKVVMQAIQWITEQTQGKPAPAPQASTATGKALSEMTNEEMHQASGLTDNDWEAFRVWLADREGAAA